MTLLEAVKSVLDACTWQVLITVNSRVVVKQNLNSTELNRVENTNTYSAFVDAVCRILQTRIHDITFVEANGYRHPAEEAFRASGIYVAERTGVKLV